MNRCEKIAWFNLAVLSIAVMLFPVLFLFARVKLDIDISRSILFATSAFSLAAITAFSPLIFKGSNKESFVFIDDHGTILRKKRRVLYFILLSAVLLSLTFALWILMSVLGLIKLGLNIMVISFYVGFFLLFAFLAFYYIKRQKQSPLNPGDSGYSDTLLYGPDMDERDLKIHKTARWSGFGFFWIVYVFGLMGSWTWAMLKGIRAISVDITLLPLFVMGAFILILLVDSVMTVILYRTGK